MGMDLVSRKKDKSIHYNWTGWGELHNLLRDLGCDISEMRGCNDGDYIKASTCKAWAKTLKNATLEGRVGLKRRRLAVGGDPLSQDDVIWLQETWEFLESCGGCRQW